MSDYLDSKKDWSSIVDVREDLGIVPAINRLDLVTIIIIENWLDYNQIKSISDII